MMKYGLPIYLLGRQLTMRIKLSPVAVIASTLIMVVGGVGIADAATGGDFLLGKSNSESSPASLSNSKGTPLALSAPKNTAPLAVNRSTMVKNLNANFVGGLSATSIKPAGGDDFTPVDDGLAIAQLATVTVAQTGKLAAGTYYVFATANIELATGNSGAICHVVRADNVDHALSEGGASGSGSVQAAETVAVRLKNNERLAERCFTEGVGNSSSTVSDAGITAIRVLSSSGSKPAR
jgi:hypothetical protein